MKDTARATVIRTSILSASASASRSSRSSKKKPYIPSKPSSSTPKTLNHFPILSTCHSCGTRANTALQTLASQWRIVLLCPNCITSIESSEICSYCFSKVSISPSDGIDCSSCDCRVHRSCLSFLPTASNSFTCVDCWEPKARKRPSPPDPIEKSAPVSKPTGGASRELTILAGQGSGSAPGPRSAPAPWRPRMETQPGKPLNVEDRLMGNADVIGALAKACALPRDMETHERFDNESLMVSAIRANLLNVQRLLTVVGRSDRNATRVTQLESERDRLKKELEESREGMEGMKKASAEEAARLASALADVAELTAKANHLKGEVWTTNKRTAELESELARLKAESTAEGTRLRGEVLAGRAETAKLKTANAELEKEKASLLSEAQSAFQDGVDHATELYEKQVEEITAILFEEGCWPH